MVIIFKYTSVSMSGWECVKMNTTTRQFVTFNTASTAESYSADLTVKVASKSELKEICERLVTVNGYRDKELN